MNKIVKTFACSALLVAASATANAATIGYSVDSAANSGNAYGGAPMTASGSFVYDTTADTLTGSIVLDYTYAPFAIDLDYTADWAVDFGTGNLVATNVTCVDNNLAPVDGCADFVTPPGGFAGVMSVTAGDLSIDTIGNAAGIRRFLGGAPISSSFQDIGLTSTGPVSAVPVPAAAWLFGSALLGLVGAGRRKLKAA